ncbi:MAG TPA: C25 family cysteine peptidase [Lacipirellulaceae bacterium]|nr:C25 family cysteine peptidase [Lacipirellulaceae bacterium]
MVLIAVWIAALGSQAFAKPDTLVVCPAPFRDALREWEAYRHAQGHEILVVDSPKSAAALQQTIRQVGAAGGLKYVLLIGQAPSVRSMNDRPANTTVPTNYVTAKVNIRWGSDAHIATDIPFADLDGDNLPDVAIGRIPASSPAQLVSVLRKSMNYERLTTHDAWERKLDIASGNGNFGAVTDALIEAAARQVITQCVPAEYVTQHICPANINVGEGASALGFAAMARQQLNEGSLAWVYLGHGWITELDRVPTLTGKGSESILSVGDVTKLHCGGHSPLAVLVACYTGAMDAPQKCLANELLMADEGPVAVIAATRVTMPYGNTVLGCELLRACFRDRPEHLGDTLLLAERKTLAPSSDDQLRTSLDSLAGGLSPMPVDLTSERQEHVMMYHLFGDPLLHLRRPVMNEAPLVDGASSSH